MVPLGHLVPCLYFLPLSLSDLLCAHWLFQDLPDLEDVDDCDTFMEDQTKVSTLFPIPQKGLKLWQPSKYWDYRHELGMPSSF